MEAPAPPSSSACLGRHALCSSHLYAAFPHRFTPKDCDKRPFNLILKPRRVRAQWRIPPVIFLSGGYFNRGGNPASGGSHEALQRRGQAAAEIALSCVVLVRALRRLPPRVGDGPHPPKRAEAGVQADAQPERAPLEVTAMAKTKKMETERTDPLVAERELLTRLSRGKPGEGRHVRFSSVGELRLILEKGHFALLNTGRSPAYPEDADRPAEFFRERAILLENDLVALGYSYTKVTAQSSEVGGGDQFMVHNPDEKDMLELGATYHQESIIISDRQENRMIYLAGEHKGKVRYGHGRAMGQ